MPPDSTSTSFCRITVNGQQHAVVPDKPITYEEIVERAGQRGTPSVVYHGRVTIDGEHYEKSGILSPGKSVKPLDGTHFTAVHTGNA
jgi:hypothetical protein